MATAVVSEPPRPSVVISPFGSMPWKPAMTGMAPSAIGLHDALGMHLDDFRALMRAVGFDARLTASEAKGFVTASLDCHGQKRHGHLLARGQKAVHLAHGRVGVKGPCQAHKLVGGFAHGGNDSDDVVASLLARDQALSDFLNALRRGDGRAPEFADD